MHTAKIHHRKKGASDLEAYQIVIVGNRRLIYHGSTPPPPAAPTASSTPLQRPLRLCFFLTRLPIIFLLLFHHNTDRTKMNNEEWLYLCLPTTGRRWGNSWYNRAHTCHAIEDEGYEYLKDTRAFTFRARDTTINIKRNRTEDQSGICIEEIEAWIRTS